MSYAGAPRGNGKAPKRYGVARSGQAGPLGHPAPPPEISPASPSRWGPSASGQEPPPSRWVRCPSRWEASPSSSATAPSGGESPGSLRGRPGFRWGRRPSGWESCPSRRGTLPSRAEGAHPHGDDPLRFGHVAHPGGRDPHRDGRVAHPDGCVAHPARSLPIPLGALPIEMGGLPIQLRVSPIRIGELARWRGRRPQADGMAPIRLRVGGLDFADAWLAFRTAGLGSLSVKFSTHKPLSLATPVEGSLAPAREWLASRASAYPTA